MEVGQDKVAARVVRALYGRVSRSIKSLPHTGGNCILTKARSITAMRSRVLHSVDWHILGGEVSRVA